MLLVQVSTCPDKVNSSFEGRYYRSLLYKNFFSYKIRSVFEGRLFSQQNLISKLVLHTIENHQSHFS
jgi:hypothetical protein